MLNHLRLLKTKKNKIQNKMFWASLRIKFVKCNSKYPEIDLTRIDKIHSRMKFSSFTFSCKVIVLLTCKFTKFALILAMYIKCKIHHRIITNHKMSGFIKSMLTFFNYINCLVKYGHKRIKQATLIHSIKMQFFSRTNKESCSFFYTVAFKFDSSRLQQPG